MAFRIGIEVDSNRIAWVQNSDRQGSVLTKLTTLTEAQSVAVIKFYLKNQKDKFLIRSETVGGLNRQQREPPSIDVLTKIEGRSIHYLISLNGRTIKDDKINIRKYTRARLPLFIILIAAAAAAAAAVVFLLLPLTADSTSGLFRDKPETNRTPAVSAKKPETTEKPTARKDAEKQTVEHSEPVEAPDAAESAAVITDAKPEEPQPEAEEKPVVSWAESEIYDKHSVYFSPDSAVLTPSTISMLNSFIASLPANDDFEEGFFELAVRGHCAKYGTEEGRADLSRERAFNVTNYLRSRWGIEADYTTSGAGASEPVSLERDEQHLNRRADIEIKGSIRKKIVLQQ